MKYEINAKNAGSFDCIVVGGGIAGISAAVSAARNGAKTLLIEKSINLGGLATNGLISWYEPLCDGRGNQVVYGIAEELIRLSVKYCFDNMPETWGGSGINSAKNRRYATLFSPAVFSLALDEFVRENGVKLRFDTYSTYPVTQGNICRGVICESIGGAEFFEAKTVIDASGDASICHRAGIPTVEGRNYMSYVAHMYSTDDANKLKVNDTCGFRSWISTGSDLFGNGHPEGMKMFSGTSAEETTKFVEIGKQRLLDRIKKRDRNSFDIMTLPQMPQYRKIRRIVGDCDFEGIPGKTYSDSIGKCGDFRPDGAGKIYEIPMGALKNKAVKNIFACGRIISSPDGDAWEVARVIPVCSLTGEAAGKAAAKQVKENCYE